MADFIIRNSQEIDDFLAGCAFYGTGGGGEVAAGKESLERCLANGLEIKLKDPADIKDDEVYCCPFFMGSIAPRTQETIDEMNRLGYKELKYDYEDILIGAVKTLEQYLGRKVDGIYVAEPGGSNSGCCIAAASKMGIPILDADPAGRAIPEAVQGLPAIRGMKNLPIAYFDGWGNSNITSYAMNYGAIERIGKYLSEASYGIMAEAAYVYSGKEVRDILVYNSLSQCAKVGKAINDANAKGECPTKAAATASGGFIVGEGVITSVETSDHDGYYWGTYVIEGKDGNTYKVWFKNENHVLWKNDIPYVTSPDLISIINLETKQPLLNTYLKEGLKVSIVATPIHDKYLDEKALEKFSPRYFGFDFDYIPFNQIEK